MEVPVNKKQAGNGERDRSVKSRTVVKQDGQRHKIKFKQSMKGGQITSAGVAPVYKDPSKVQAPPPRRTKPKSPPKTKN